MTGDVGVRGGVARPVAKRAGWDDLIASVAIVRWLDGGERRGGYDDPRCWSSKVV